MAGSNFKFWNVKKTLDAGLKIMTITLLSKIVVLSPLKSESKVVFKQRSSLQLIVNGQVSFIQFL
jgi:hypothetical protein